eukprot:CAMPEP_0176336652 /NCGR_PEP_ID=MMETSP0121_2-20121125/79230_1 /TAXON_ID=160619 /ORGANISM="Kryptoperidinium foliaceum, Strain CCMP 1326" /LENGTH=102 /DNA_ID=CAMNT_0017679643 /DNA_START=703 /DNA_END=1009 /DNA_ORIENTATION=+
MTLKGVASSHEKLSFFVRGGSPVGRTDEFASARRAAMTKPSRGGRALLVVPGPPPASLKRASRSLECGHLMHPTPTRGVRSDRALATRPGPRRQGRALLCLH